MLNSSIDDTMNSGNPARILGRQLLGPPLGVGDAPDALVPLPEADANRWGDALGLGVGVGVYSYISGYTGLNDSRPLGGDDMTPSVKPHDLTNATTIFLCNNTFKDSLMMGDNASDGGMDAMNLTRLQQENDLMFTRMVNMIALTVVLGLIILVTIIGNVFVIAAIILERNLQNVANYLVASLAVADLLVACLVMPLGAVYEISQGWILGPELCDIWTSCDVLCCTASILHLVAIAADRYWTVTNIDYNNLRTPRRVFCMIFCVWSAAVVVSLAPQFGWKDPEYMQRIEEQKCMVSQDVAYQIFATCCTFYVPLLIILGLYWKIYQIARKRIQRHAKRQFPTGSKPIAGQTPQGGGAAAAAAKAGAASATGSNEKGATASSSTPASGDSNQRRRFKACFDKAGTAAAASAGSEPRAGSTLDVYPRNSFSMAHTREETDFSTSNFDSKSHAGTEVTTVSSDADEVASTVHSQQARSMALATTSASHISAQQPKEKEEMQEKPEKEKEEEKEKNDKQQAKQDKQQKKEEKQQQKGQQKSQPGTRHTASVPNPHQKLAKRRQMLEAKRERKAAQTLAIITGAFAVCWLPFFVMVLLLTLCKECHIHAAIASLVLWLGYFNSTLNPIIYTIFNPEFRRAFQRMLFGRKRFPLHQRSGKI